MKAIVIGGHTRNIGKTSVMTGLIRDLASLGWTAVKITQYGHGVCSQDGQPCDCAPTEHPFVLSEEHDAAGRGDTCRYLAAGARRSLWLRARQGQLAQAFPLLQQAVAGEEWVIIESNSVLEFLKPLLYLVVLDGSSSDFKSSARRFFELADALVPIESRVDMRVWPGLDPASLGKPVFPVGPRQYASPELSGFVRQRLEIGGPASIRAGGR
ncbi:MAG TPA: hypothetical protein VGW33_00460 [Terriglobia bacterium]|nr:hypothetical protein [Terriglobia bacterium]